MVDTVQQEVPKTHEASLPIPIGVDFVGVDLLVCNQLEKFASLELHLLFEKVLINVSLLAPVQASVLPVVCLFFDLVRVTEKVFFILIFKCQRLRPPRCGLVVLEIICHNYLYKLLSFY